LVYGDLNRSGDDPVLWPFQAVSEMVRLAVTSGWRGIKRGAVNPFGNMWRMGRRVMTQWRRRMNRMTLIRREEEWIERGENNLA